MYKILLPDGTWLQGEWTSASQITNEQRSMGQILYCPLELITFLSNRERRRIKGELSIMRSFVFTGISGQYLDRAEVLEIVKD